MAFESFSSLIEMKGHGVYVWSSVAFACVVLGLNLLVPWLKSRKLVIQLKDEPKQN